MSYSRWKDSSRIFSQKGFGDYVIGVQWWKGYRSTFGAYVANDVLNVASQEDLEGRLTIIDAAGRMVYVKDNVQLNHSGVKIDLSGMTDGIYIVTFATAETIMTKKVLK